MSKNMKKLMEEAGITEEMVDAARSSESIFLSYIIKQKWVRLEVIAPNLTEALLQLPPDLQEKMVAALVGLVPEIGDSEVLDDDSDHKKRRGARVIRMKSEEEGEINLLLTR